MLFPLLKLPYGEWEEPKLNRHEPVLQKRKSVHEVVVTHSRSLEKDVAWIWQERFDV